ncbi:MAG: tryptophan synthase subunit beta [Candidatus Cryosericum sp.]
MTTTLPLHADEHGFYGEYGGQFVPPQLGAILDRLNAAFHEALADPSFTAEMDQLLRDYVGRPSPLYLARRLTEHAGGARIYLKREDLNHTGAHKINNALGQGLLARRMGAHKLIAETGAGQHGVATATVAALLGMGCDIYMGAEDIRRQHPNVVRMELLGASVHSVTEGQATLKDAVDAALGAWAADPEASFYLLGSAVGPHPYPEIVRTFQSVIGREARAQALQAEGRLPDAAIACVGGGSNAIGLFADFIEDKGVALIGVEPAGKGLATGLHAATITAGHPEVIHGMRTYVLADDQGTPTPCYSVAAGLDYPGVGPQHAALKDAGRATYVTASDDEALEAFELLSRLEGIIPALESSHAIAYAVQLARTMRADQFLVVNLSGRGDKDVDEVQRLFAARKNVAVSPEAAAL